MIRIQQMEKGFDEGKQYLDNGNFQECINVYDEIIPCLEKLQGNPEFNGILEGSYNNRGVAKCKLALISKNRQQYEDGLADIEASVDLSNAKTDHEKMMLIAFGNLNFGKEELKKFPNATGSDLKSTIKAHTAPGVL